MIKSLELILVFFAVAFLIGSLPVSLIKRSDSGLLRSILYGCIIMIATFEVLVIPMIIVGQTLSTLLWVWGGFILALSVASLLLARKFILQQVKNIPTKCKKMTYLQGILLVLILVQVFICVKYIFLHADDAYYVGMATTTLDTNRLLSFSPYTGQAIHWSNYKAHMLASLPIFWAMLARVFGVSGAVMCHSIAPAIFIPIGYILYREIAMLLLKADKKAILFFLIFICISNFFIGKDYNASYEMLTTSIWQGGTFLANIALPGIFYFEFKLLQKDRNLVETVMFLMMIGIGIMTVPSTGVLLSILLVVVLGGSFMVEKIWTRRKRIDAGINV